MPGDSYTAVAVLISALALKPLEAGFHLKTSMELLRRHNKDIQVFKKLYAHESVFLCKMCSGGGLPFGHLC